MMEQEPAIKQKNYERASQLLGRLFEVDSDITEQINRCLQDYGAKGFFRNLESFDFSEDVFKKLKADGELKELRDLIDKKVKGEDNNA